MYLPLADPTSTSRNQYILQKYQQEGDFLQNYWGERLCAIRRWSVYRFGGYLGGNENERRKPTYA
jgi:hypothetical protein